MIRAFKRVLACALLAGLQLTEAAATPIDFEAYTDNTPLTNEEAGLTFSGGVILTAGVSLNEFDFPPTSGVNVLGALSGTLDIALDTPATGFSGYFSHLEELTFSGYDSLHNLLFSIATANSSNLGGSTLISHSADGLALLSITGAQGLGFTLDDLDIQSAAAIPEPGSLALLMLGGLSALAAGRKRRCPGRHG